MFLVLANTAIIIYSLIWQHFFLMYESCCLWMLFVIIQWKITSVKFREHGVGQWVVYCFTV